MRKKRKVRIWVGPPGRAVWFAEKEIFEETTALQLLESIAGIFYYRRERWHMDIVQVGPLERKKGEVFVVMLRWAEDGKIKEVKNINPAALIIPPSCNVDLYLILEPVFLYR